MDSSQRATCPTRPGRALAKPPNVASWTICLLSRPEMVHQHQPSFCSALFSSLYWSRGTLPSLGTPYSATRRNSYARFRVSAPQRSILDILFIACYLDLSNLCWQVCSSHFCHVARLASATFLGPRYTEPCPSLRRFLRMSLTILRASFSFIVMECISSRATFPTCMKRNGHMS